MKDLDLKSLRLFLAVCDTGNIKRAAQEANIEPSAISKRIAQLESDLKTTLLLRGRRGVQPTPAGQALLEHARSLQFTIERIEADVSSYAGGIKGHVRLVASASAVAESLLDDIALFLRDPFNQGIKVDIEERLSVEVIKAVRDGSASLGVCWDSASSAGLGRAPYRRDELVLAVHPEHPLAAAGTVWFKDTLGFEQVGLPPATAVYQMLHRAAAQAEGVMSYRIVVSTFDAALRVVCANMGVSVIPREVSERYIRSGEIAIVSLKDAWAQRQFAILFRDRHDLSPAAERLIQHLAQRATVSADAGPRPVSTNPASPSIKPAKRTRHAN